MSALASVSRHSMYCANPMTVTHTSQAGMTSVASHPHQAIAGCLRCDWPCSAIFRPVPADMTLRRLECSASSQRTDCRRDVEPRIGTLVYLAVEIRLQLSGNQVASRSRFGEEPCDHTGAIFIGPVLTSLGLRFDRRDRELDTHDGLELLSHE